MYNLLERVKVTTVVGASGLSVGNSTFIDMAGWEGCMFILPVPSGVVSTGSLIVQQSSAASTGAGILQSTFSNAVTYASKDVGIVDVVRPLKRYIRLKHLTCTGAGSIAIQYNSKLAGTTDAKVNIGTWSGVHVCTS